MARVSTVYSPTQHYKMNLVSNQGRRKLVDIGFAISEHKYFIRVYVHFFGISKARFRRFLEKKEKIDSNLVKFCSYSDSFYFKRIVKIIF